jgi:hypothetical protein
MAAGYPVNRAVIDSRAGYIVKTLKDTLAQAVTLKGVLDGLNDAALTSMNYTTTEITELRNGIADISNLAATANGQRAQTPASDFFFNAKKLTGVE